MWKGYPPWKGFGAYGLAWAIDMSWEGGILRLRFDAQTGSFSVGNAVTGGTSGSTGRIVAIQDDGADGVLTLDRITGPFLDDEIVYESALGSELVTNGDMELDSDWADYQTPDTNERSSVEKHGGSYSRHVVETGGAGHFDGVTQTISGLTAGYFYTVLLWYKRISGTLFIGLRKGSDGGFHDPPLYVGAIDSGTDWTKWTRNFSLMAGETSLALRAQAYNDSAEFYFDDASIKQVTNAAFANGVLY